MCFLLLLHKTLTFRWETYFKRGKKLQKKKVFNKTQLTPQSNANDFFYAQMLNDEYNPDNLPSEIFTDNSPAIDYLNCCIPMAYPEILWQWLFQVFKVRAQTARKWS